jgi:hypothetical protein
MKFEAPVVSTVDHLILTEGTSVKTGKVLMAISLVAMLLMMVNAAAAEMIFGVKPSTVVQSSYFGFLAGTSMIIEFGLDYARVGVKVEGDAEGGLGLGEIDADVSASMMMPHGGVKLYLKPRAAGATSPYFLADLFKAFTSIDPGDVDEATEDAITSVEELLSPFGLNLGFGAEYHFSDRFSVGGEYGFRYMMSSTEFEEIDMKVDTNLGMTYAAITANFAF